MTVVTQTDHPKSIRNRSDKNVVHMYKYMYSNIINFKNSPVSPACRKRRLNRVVARNNRKKDWSCVSPWTGTLKNPTKCL